MIHPRLADVDYVVKREARDVEEGRQAVAQPWAAGARGALSRYLQGALEELSSRQWTDEAMVSFCEKHPFPAPSADTANPWPADLQDQVEFSLRHPHEHKFAGADWLIGLGMFDALVVRARAADGPNVAHILALNATRVLAFAECVRGASAETTTKVSAAMTAFAHHERTPPERNLIGRNAEYLREALKQWVAEYDVTAVWDQLSWRGLEFYPDGVGMLMPLADANPACFLPVIEELQLPPLVHGALQWRSISADLDKVLTLLAAAPTPFGADGQWNRKLVAALLLEMAFDCVTALGTYKDDDGKPLASADEQGAMAKRIVERTLTRSDGVALLAGWTRHLLFLAKSRAGDAGFGAVFNVTLAALADCSITLQQVYPTLSGDELSPKELHPQLQYDAANDAFDRLTLAAMLAQERAQRATAPVDRALRPSFLSLMRAARRPFGPQYAEAMPSWRHYPFSDVYLASAEPAKLWREDFDSFALERRSRVHYAYVEDDSLPAPSLFLSGVALTLMDICVEGARGTDLRKHALEIWFEVFDATRQHFTHWTLSAEQWRQVAGALFIRYPMCVRAACGDTTDFRAAKEWLQLLGTDELLFASAVASLVANNVSVDAIGPGAEFADDARRRISAFLEWQGGAGSRALAPAAEKILREQVLNTRVGAGG